MMFRSLSWPLVGVILAVLSTGPLSLHAAQEPAGAAGAGDSTGTASAGAGDPDASRDIFRIDVPGSWTYLPDQSQRLAESALSQPLPGDVPVEAQVQAWRGNGAGLVISWLKTAVPADTPAVLARALLEQVRLSPGRASLEPGDATPGSWDERMADGVADARMEWTHLRNGTTTLSRSVVFQTASGQVHMVRADCMLAAGNGAGDAAGDPAADTAASTASGAARNPAWGTCQHVLGSLTVVPPPADRRALAALPEVPAHDAAELAAQAATEPATDTGNPAGTAGKDGHALETGTPAFREPVMGRDGVLVMQPSQKRGGRSNQWLYVLGGILLVLAVYMTTRSRSSEREKSDEEQA